MSLLRFSQTFIFPGTLVDEQVFGIFTADVGVNINQAQISCQTAPTGANVTVDLVNGAGTSLSALATLTAASKDQVTTFASPISVAANGTIRAKIKSIGSTEPGVFLVLTIIGTYDPTEITEVFPDAVDVCTLFGYQYVNGLPAVGTRVSIRLNESPVISSTTIFEHEPRSVDTDEDGYWEIDLVQNQNYLLTIWRSGILNKSIVIPVQNTCNVATLI